MTTNRRLRHLIQPGSKATLFLVLLCLAYVYASGLPALKAEPARPADINSIKAIYDSRSQPDRILSDVIRFVGERDPSHLPLYWVVLSHWMRFTGRDLFTIRLLSLLIGMLAIASTYRLARDTAGRASALDSAWMLSFLAFFIFYAHQARMYTMLVLAAAWVLWRYWRLLNADDSRWRIPWLMLLLSCLVIVYTHYFGFFLLAAVGAYHLLFAPKNMRWLQICLAMGAAGLLFLPWLPVTLTIMAGVDWPASDALSIGGALGAFASIFSNGAPILLAMAGIVLLMRFRQLQPAQFFILFTTLAAFALLLLANEITILLVARRIRYTIAAGALLICVIAIALNQLPRWHLLRWLFAALWIIAHFFYLRSDELYLYTNQFHQRHHAVPHFQDLLYEPSIQPRGSDMILTFHPDTPLNDKKQLDYYGRKVGAWRGLIHIWQDEAGNALAQSTDTRYRDLASMANWRFPIWLLHNPQETELASMPVFADDFAGRFHRCGRYLESDDAVVDLYALRAYPCQLLTAPAPLEIHYDNGTRLVNVLLQPRAGALDIYLWFANTTANQYAFSLQLVDSDDQRVAQADDVISGDALQVKTLDAASLPSAEYSARLIVYDFESHEVQPGVLLAQDLHFERELEVARVRLGA